MAFRYLYLFLPALLLLCSAGLAQSPQGKAFAQNEKLGRGINLGNALEAPNEGEWGVTLQAAYFELIAEQGFNSVRIPIRWSAHAQQTAPYTISETFSERIDWAIEQALLNGLLVIINMHHYEEIFTDPDGEKERFLQMWAQISSRYKDYSDSLLFEVLNEPHDQLTPEKWNEFLADARSVIRTTNPDRTIIAGTSEWGGTSALNKLIIPPGDDNIILTVHFYNPFQFTHQGAEWVGGSNTWLGTGWLNTYLERRMIDNELAAVVAYSQSHAVPVNLGEFGAYSKADTASRKRWTNFCARLFEEKGFSWHYWEFCAGFGIYDPTYGTWNQYLVDALLTLPMPEPNGDDTGDLLYNGDFSNHWAGWYLYIAPQAQATGSIENETCQITISAGGTEHWHVQLMNTGVFLEQNQPYHVEFDIWSSNNRTALASVSKNAEPWTAYSPIKTFSLSTTPVKHEFEFTMIQPSDPSARFLLDLGKATGVVYVDNVKLTKAGQSVWETVKPTMVKIFPNPVSTECVIEGKYIKSAQLYGFDGQKLRDVHGTCGSDLRIDMTSEPAGIYLIIVTDVLGNSGSFKIVKN